MAESTVIAFSCPNCGAEVDMLEGHTNVKCNFCRSRLLVTQKIGAARVFARPKLSNPKRFLRNVAGEEIKIIDLDLLFVPLIKVRAEVIGWIKAHKRGEVKKDTTHYSHGGGNIQSPGSSPVVGEKRVKKRIRRIQDINIDPSAFYRFGVKRIKLEGKKFEAYNDEILHRFGNVFDLPRSVDEYIEEASDKLIRKNTDRYRKWDEFKHYLKTIKESPLIYYNPVYFARIEKDGVPYTYSIDAVNGDVLLRDEVVKMEGKKKSLGINVLYGIIFAVATIISISMKITENKFPFLIAGFLLMFFIWWGQYGNR